MKIESKARKFAIKAHKGQVRKSDKDKPMIIHPINVANILKEYDFDQNVISAGYLHDVVEDTKYEIENIKKMFGEDIASLVWGASEEDKSLSWEERKKHTIEKTKTLDLRHKAVICADKISNLEDLRILYELNGESVFSSFKRGFESQKWYYTEVYNSLIMNEDKNYPMFIRLKEIIDYIFYNKNSNGYVKDIIFKDSIDEYNLLKNIHYRKEEVFKLKNVLSKKKPYVIEFTGTPRTGKTSLINNLKDFFKKKGFRVCIIEEFTTSLKYKTQIYPTLKNKSKNVVNTEIPKYVLKDLDDAINSKYDIIIVDRSLFDRLIWVDRLFLKKGMSDEEYNKYKSTYIPLIKEKINIIVSLYTDSLTCLKRDYHANLSLENRTFLNEDNVNEYNKSLLNMEKLSIKENINFKMFDTTNKNQREISFEVIDSILSDMRKYYLSLVIKEFN